MKQKFQKGDLVRIAKNLGSSMSHFTADCDAIVIGSYADEYGGNDTKSYTIHIKGHGETSWYQECQLTLIANKQIGLLRKWKKEEDSINKLHSDLNWIFKNGLEVCKSATGATIESLAKCLGITNLWGSHGEGYVYYSNALAIMALARDYLVNNDKKGWLKFCKETIKKRTSCAPRQESVNCTG